VPCFTTGTRITTLKGEVPVEELSTGDRVVTRDNGLQSLRRILRRDFDFGQLSVVPHLKPVLVTTGSLGKDLPERDMLLSPNLRLLVANDRLPFGAPEREQLVAVKQLTDGHTIRSCATLGVSYVHLGFIRHEVVLANGVWAEAFQSEDPSLGAVGNAQRTELLEIFADLRPEPDGRVKGRRGALSGSKLGA